MASRIPPPRRPSVGPPPSRPASPTEDEDVVDVAPLAPKASRAIELLRPSAVPRGIGAEMKYYTAFNTMGILSQNTWGAVVSSTGVWNSISLGTDQDDRLGRRIRVHRYRIVLNPSDQAYDTICAAYTVMRTDSNIAASDLFVSSGSARSQYDHPNPVGQSAVYKGEVGSAMQFAGACGGTTPSYCNVVLVHDVNLGRGRVVSYDVSGATGPTIMTYFNTSETSITLDYGVQVWFTDA